MQPDELPVMVCPNGAVLKRPTDVEAGVCLGITPELEPSMLHDVVVVGAGPAGLAAAVYAASEGLSVMALDQRRSAGRPAPRRGSRTISAFRPAFPAARWPDARSARR